MIFCSSMFIAFQWGSVALIIGAIAFIIIMIYFTVISSLNM